MLKSVLSIIGGLVLAFALVFATDAFFHAFSSTATPPPNLNDKDAMRAYIEGQPFGVLAGLIAGWAVAVFAGASLASRFAHRGEWPGFIVTGLFLLATLANFLMAPHPRWMVMVGVTAILFAGWLGSRTGALVRRRSSHQP